MKKRMKPGDKIKPGCEKSSLRELKAV